MFGVLKALKTLQHWRFNVRFVPSKPLTRYAIVRRSIDLRCVQMNRIARNRRGLRPPVVGRALPDA